VGGGFASRFFLDKPEGMHDDVVELMKVIAVAFAVGLDVFAISIGVGVAQLAWNASFRVGVVFAGSEIVMQVIGYALGTGAGKMIGEIAAWLGLVLLALIGALMIRSSLRPPLVLEGSKEFDASRGSGLALTALSVSLDSLGVGVALPGVAIPLVPLLVTLSITTTVFTLTGLAFGARLGARYERGAERTAGIMLIALAALFSGERLI
jgi:putative Mn2+ efflux pump MntP